MLPAVFFMMLSVHHLLTAGIMMEHDEHKDSYWHSAKKPLEVLLFLLPFLVFYEICLVFVLQRAGEGTLTNWAHEALNRYLNFAIPDMLGLSFPAIAVVVVLLSLTVVIVLLIVAVVIVLLTVAVVLEIVVV